MPVYKLRAKNLKTGRRTTLKFNSKKEAEMFLDTPRAGYRRKYLFSEVKRTKKKKRNPRRARMTGFAYGGRGFGW